MNEEYQLKLKEAIIESFNYFDEDLYNDLKDNIMPLEKIATWIILMKKFVDLIENIEDVNKMNIKVFHCKSIYCISKFILRMNELYTQEMLKNAIFKLEDKYYRFFKNENEDGLFILDQEKSRIIKPFEFIMISISATGDLKYHLELIDKLILFSIILLMNFNCYTCNKFRILKHCEDCVPTEIEEK